MSDSSLYAAKRIILVVLVVAAPLYTLSLIRNYGITVPFLDQWELVPLLGKAHTNELSISDIWAQHNEHRIFFPQVVMLAMASMTNWDIMYELYANMVLAGLIFFFLYRLVLRSLGESVPLWLLSALSFLVFSPAQFENWGWGWEIQVFMSVLFTIVAVWAIVQWPDQLKGVLVAATAAVISSYSFNNGLLTWIIVGVILIAQRDRKWRYILIWSSAFIMALVLYYYGYTKPGHHPPLVLFLKYPFYFILYVLAYIGSPIGFYNGYIAIIAGLSLVIMLSVITIIIRRSSREMFEKALPWLALALYSFFSAAATGIGRLGFGVSQALSSRYITISLLFIIATLVITVIFINNHLRINKRLPITGIAAISVVSALFIVCYSFSFSAGRSAMVNKHQISIVGADCLQHLEIAPDGCLQIMYPDPVKVRERANRLLAMGITFSER